MYEHVDTHRPLRPTDRTTRGLKCSVKNVKSGGVMVKALACDSKGHEFNSRPFRCQVTTLGKLFTHMCLCYQAVKFGTSRRQRCLAIGKVTVDLALHWPCVTHLSGLSTYGFKA